MPDNLIELANYNNPSLIKVIGVGGGGGNAVAQMYRDNIPEVRYMVANTDKKALEDSPIPDRLQIGPGLGAGGDPAKGKELAEMYIEDIQKIFDDETKMVFITAGMGGGTGTGASPIIAREARNRNILTIGIVTIPFLFEREKQIDKALDGLEILAKEVDALLVINNQRLCDIYPNLGIIDAFRQADRTLSTAVSSITEIISMHGRVNLDFEDVRTVLTNGGVAVMSTGFGEGENRVTQAIETALNSPLLNNNDVYNADRILIAITTSSNPDTMLKTCEMDEVQNFMARFSPEIRTKWGLALDETLGNKVKFTVLASGFGLYNKKKKIQQEEKIEQIPAHVLDRRIRFYTDKKNAIQRKSRIFLFSDEDLRNEKLLALVEDVPTKLRTNEMLESIQQLSSKH